MISTIISLFVKYAPHLVEAGKSVPEILNFVSSLYNILKRSDKWTDEEEAAFDKKVAAAKSDPAWQIDQ